MVYQFDSNEKLIRCWKNILMQTHWSVEFEIQSRKDPGDRNDQRLLAPFYYEKKALAHFDWTVDPTRAVRNVTQFAALIKKKKSFKTLIESGLDTGSFGKYRWTLTISAKSSADQAVK